MTYVVLVAWLIQSSVGLANLIAWRRDAGGDRRGSLVLHVSSAVVGFVLWVVFVASGSLVAAWAAFAVITFGTTFGDMLMVAGHRRATGTSASYGQTIGAVFTGHMPPRIVFHALFSPVVYFGCLAACIIATVAAAS
ncbi:MAG TPA: hypothetical protein VFK68_00460 [Propionibacteriaceae bacterium]|nr:hypothetical protein [Propionibacteriaceae bacterium]